LYIQYMIKTIWGFQLEIKHRKTMSSHYSYVRIGENYLKRRLYDLNIYQLNMIYIKMSSDRPRGKDILVLLYLQLTF
jgi:hypothetical protein